MWSRKKNAQAWWNTLGNRSSLAIWFPKFTLVGTPNLSPCIICRIWPWAEGPLLKNKKAAQPSNSLKRWERVALSSICRLRPSRLGLASGFREVKWIVGDSIQICHRSRSPSRMCHTIDEFRSFSRDIETDHATCRLPDHGKALRSHSFCPGGRGRTPREAEIENQEISISRGIDGGNLRFRLSFEYPTSS